MGHQKQNVLLRQMPYRFDDDDDDDMMKSNGKTREVCQGIQCCCQGRSQKDVFCHVY